MMISPTSHIDGLSPMPWQVEFPALNVTYHSQLGFQQHPRYSECLALCSSSSFLRRLLVDVDYAAFCGSHPHHHDGGH